MATKTTTTKTTRNPETHEEKVVTTEKIQYDAPDGAGIFKDERSPISAESAASHKTADELYYPAPDDPMPAEMSHWAPITTGGFVGTMLLLLIPGINLIFLFIWAFGGARKMQKRYYARAALIVIAIGIVLFAIATLIFGAFWVEWYGVLGA